MTSADMYKELKLETIEKLPNFLDTKLFKDGAEYSGVWTEGHYQYRYKSLPQPIAPVRAPVSPVPKGKPIKCGVWNGQKFVPTRAIEINASIEERLRIINEAFAIGNEVRYFVHDREVNESELKAGQQHSIYPKRFERQADVSASTKEKTLPIRTEGPMIRLQWIVLADTGVSLMLPVSVSIPEEISLAQLWHRHVANRIKRHVETVKWGKHYRANVEVESGQVSDLQDGDVVE
jgi:hypothetical protein